MNECNLIQPPNVVILSTQRSGTHLLQSVLGSHPDIQTRGEFVLQYRRQREAGVERPDLAPGEVGGYRYRNRQGRTNIGIVMYSEVDLFEQLCGPLHSCRIIHLLRDPAQTARSVVQMAVDRGEMGTAFRAHYHRKDRVALPCIVAITDEEQAIARQIQQSQSDFAARLLGANGVLTVTYDELCKNEQVNELPTAVASRLLQFLGLNAFPLKTELVKTGLRGTGVNSLTTRNAEMMPVRSA